MARKIMLEVTQPVVSGNEVLYHSGDLYASLGDVPDGVQVRPVIVPDPAPEEPGPAPEPEAAAKAPAKPAAKAPEGKGR